MTRNRLVIAALACTVVAVLFVWQLRRERLVKACLDAGALWDGPRSTCKPLPNRPILQRDLHRS